MQFGTLRQGLALTRVEHTANLYILDHSGKLNTVVPFGMCDQHVVSMVEWRLQQQDPATSV
jgi:hypothetical protein